MDVSKNLYTKKISVTFSLVALNLIIGSLVAFFKLPIYLDSIGIVIATLLLGLRYGILCAILTVGIGFFIINPYLPAYIGTSLGIVITVHLLRKVNFYRTLIFTIISGLIVAIISAILSAPVTAYLFEGATLSGVDALTAYFHSIGNNILQAVFLSGISSEPIDKVIVALIAFLVLRSIPNSIIERNNFKFFRDV